MVHGTLIHMNDSYYSNTVQKYVHVSRWSTTTWSFLGHREVTEWYHDATLTIREAQEKDCLYWVPKNCERWPEDTPKAAEANLRRVEVYEPTLTSD